MSGCTMLHLLLAVIFEVIVGMASMTRRGGRLWRGGLRGETTCADAGGVLTIGKSVCGRHYLVGCAMARKRNGLMSSG